MKILTTTNIWAVERKIYAFGDISLPTPIGFKSLGIFFLSGSIWWLLMWVLHVPLNGPWTFMLWFGPPAAVAAIWSKRLLEGKTMPQYIQSQVRFLLEPARLYDGEADRTIGKTFRVEANVWHSYKKPCDD
jgi:hypothetical protein